MLLVSRYDEVYSAMRNIYLSSVWINFFISKIIRLFLPCTFFIRKYWGVARTMKLGGVNENSGHGLYFSEDLLLLHPPITFPLTLKKSRAPSWQKVGAFTPYTPVTTPLRPGCIPCKTHAGVTPVVPQLYAKTEGWRTSEV